MKPYQIPLDGLASVYGTDLDRGLTAARVQELSERYGPNVFIEDTSDSLLMVFLRQFSSPLIYILGAAAVLIFLLGNYVDSLLITALLLFNAIIGTVQEGRAQQVMKQLRQFAKTTCVVVRGGERLIVDDSLLVPGDIIILHAGDQVPADARVIKLHDFKVDESLLTGETQPVTKQIEALAGAEIPLFEQKNMVFKGAHVLTGLAHALVITIGMETYIGSMHQVAQESATEIPIRKDLDSFARKIVVIAAFFCVLLFIIGLLLGKMAHELLVVLTALFIAVIPEGLPVVLTLVLALGVYRMAKKKVLVKKMAAVEGLGRVEVIVVDKTGTLTRNEMMVQKVILPDGVYQVSGNGYLQEGEISLVSGSENKQVLSLLAKIALVLDTSELEYRRLERRFVVEGEPTEAALGVFAGKVGLDVEQVKNSYQIIYELPFDSDTRMHVAFVKNRDNADNSFFEVLVAGAPETVIAACAPINSPIREELAVVLQEGLRVIACAHYVVPDANIVDVQHYFNEQVKGKLELVGLCGIQDAIRPEVNAWVEKARDAGLMVIMATGDHLDTAGYVARSTAIFTAHDKMVEGIVPEEMPYKEFEHIKVFARVTPHDKLALINKYHAAHKIVAMTGDGVNDVASLMAADIGIAMGSGTDIAKEAADIILLDDSFSTIIAGVEEGSHIFYTLRRVILYFFTTNMAEVLVIVGAFILNVPLPIEPAQILWLNVVTDGFLDSALAAEPREAGILKKRRGWYVAGFINRKMAWHILFMALPMAIGSLLVFLFFYKADLAYARTMLMATLSMFQWFNAWNCRSMTLSIGAIGLFTNRWLIGATILVAVLQLGVIYIPLLQVLFKTVPLAAHDWLLVFGVSCSIVIWEELRKFIAAQRAS